MSQRLFEVSLSTARARGSLAWPTSLAIHGAGLGFLVLIPFLSRPEYPEPPEINTIIHLPAALARAVELPRPPRGRAVSAGAVVALPRAPAPTDAREPIPGRPNELIWPPDTPGPGPDAGDLPECLGCVPDGDPGGVVGGEGTGLAPKAAPAPRRPGGDVRPPVKVKDVVPVYPDLARISHVQGAVVLECVIEADGSVTSIRVVQGTPLLDEAAVSAVRQWRYRPTYLNGEPIAVIMNVTVEFRLPH